LAETLPYINNCLIDSVQQICHALPYLIRRQAELADKELVKVAMKNLADDVEAREGECMVSLWGEGGTEESPNRILGTRAAVEPSTSRTSIQSHCARPCPATGSSTPSISSTPSRASAAGR